MFTVTLIGVGRFKAGPERNLLERYVERARVQGRSLGISFNLREIEEGRARRAEDRRAEEGRSLVEAAGACPLVVFDERGTAMDSDGFSALLAQIRDTGCPGLALALGGPDGHDPAVRAKAARLICFGAMTWPHQLARIMACEQVYRAMTILSGHPYHRA